MAEWQPGMPAHTFEDVLKKYGYPTNGRRLTPEEVAPYVNRVPECLVKFWLDVGTGSFGDGVLWMPPPALLQPVLDQVFEGDPEFDPKDMCIWCYDCIGTATAIHKDRKYVLYLVYNYVLSLGDVAYIHPISKEPFPSEQVLIVDFDVTLAARNAPIDNDGELLLPQVKPKLGELLPGEIYGFFPPVNFGGDGSVESVQKTDVVSHLLFLAQADVNMLRTISPPEEHLPMGAFVDIRPIGRAPR